MTLTPTRAPATAGRRLAATLYGYSSHLDTCPWCERAALTGQDLFNPPQALPQYPGAPDAHDGVRRTTLIVAIAAALILLVVLIAVAAG
ncbi:hypothetical protein JS756_27105 [Streptomyces actuosus]|uniref:Uncharacterized protein n=1 Tax=Streptomyces actuosus TaxID=1885 RepID=A0ABS2VX38_STRAS|nr:hypothetical protein [Streptomyces actuosus]MBN0047712.1 hypothetical protein [Streptomyces actuosus]